MTDVVAPHEHAPRRWQATAVTAGTQRSLARGFRREGIPPSRIRWEDFGAR